MQILKQDQSDTKPPVMTIRTTDQVSEGFQNTLKQHSSDHGPSIWAYTHTHKHTPLLIASLCGVPVNQCQTNTPQFSTETSTPRFAQCVVIREIKQYLESKCYLTLKHLTGPENLKCDKSGINQLNLYQDVSCLQKLVPESYWERIVKRRNKPCL